MPGKIWMQMASGRPWPLLDPTPRHVHWRDIAIHLAKIPRFNGGTAEDVFYSVAQHLCLAADFVPLEYRLPVLLHDAHEAISGDQVRPVKEALAVLGGRKAWDKFIAIQDRAIYGAASLPWPLPAETVAVIKEIDDAMLATERRDLLIPGPVPSEGFAWHKLPEPLPFVIRPWPALRAADEWLERLNRWLPLARGTPAGASFECAPQERQEGIGP